MKINTHILIFAFLVVFKLNGLNAQITGPSTVNFGTTNVYTEPTLVGFPQDYEYYFTAIGGTILPGQSSTSVSIVWNKSANGIVQRWKSSMHANSVVLIHSLDIIVLNTPATEYLYNSSGNRTERFVIILNPSSLKSGHFNEGKEEAISEMKDFQVLEDKIEELEIKIYPNPTEGKIRVDLLGLDQNVPANINVYSANGVLIKSLTQVSTSNDIDLSQESNGIYFLKIEVNKKSTEWKIVKQ